MKKHNRKQKSTFLVIAFSFLFMSCTGGTEIIDYEGKSLYDVRQDFNTNIVNIQQNKSPLSIPQDSNFVIVDYPSSVGELSAYISKDPGDGSKYPAIIWVQGGYDNTISVNMLSNETMKEYGGANIIVMFPGLRGGNQNPGNYESLYGEVDDIISAVEYLSNLDYVDSHKIYLGGHSTGGTLTLLVTEMTDIFRASFSIAPMDKFQNYDHVPKPIAFDTTNQKEYDLRSPILWLDDIRTPTFVFTGTKDGNYKNFKSLKSTSDNSYISFLAIKNGNHNNVLNSVAKLIAQKIAADDEATANITFYEHQINSNLHDSK